MVLSKCYLTLLVDLTYIIEAQDASEIVSKAAGDDVNIISVLQLILTWAMRW